MKKVKIMLMSMAVLAIIGGALAFKAKFDKIYCTLTAIEVPNGTYTYNTLAACVEIKNVKTQLLQQGPVFYTEKGAVACDQVTCTTFAYTTTDGGTN